MPHHIFSIKLGIRPILFMHYFREGGGGKARLVRIGFEREANLRGQLFNEL